MNRIYHLIVGLWLVSGSFGARAQTGPLTLEQCYQLAEKHYPLTRQRGLIRKSREYSLENISKGYLPQFSIQGQATYQSDVTDIPIEVPGMAIPELSKDHYKLYGEVNQVLYDGGRIKAASQQQEAASHTQAQKLKVALYPLKDRIQQLYFGILLVDEQLQQNSLLKKDITLGIKNAQALVNNGVAFKSSVEVLKAELLKAGQQTITLKANRKAWADMLELFIHVPVDENTLLERPPSLTVSPEINRPELALFQAQMQQLDTRYDLLRARNLPKLNLFLQGGYGRPAFNILSNSFDPYYIGGVRLTIPVFGLYTLKNDKALIALGTDRIQAEKETFLFNTKLSLSRQSAEVLKLKALLQSDNEIIALRTNIKNSASARLKNGVITANDYLREVNAENRARQEKILHEIQLLMAQYNQKYTSGN